MYRQYHFTKIIVLWFTLFLAASCSQDDSGQVQKTQQPQQPSSSIAEHKPITPPKPRAMEYDLRNIRSFRETSDMYGRTIKRTYSLPAGKEINIIYSWEGGTNRCKSAEARINGQILAKAVVIDIGGSEREGYHQVVEEIHYAPDATARVIYRARSKFAISFFAEKIEEQPIEGTKIYELFTNWGTVQPGMFP